mgnify:CR=1 FL=1
MTKMHRGKKAAASLMAGILLCQMFVFGVSKTSADAREVAKKMSFEVVGEGIVTVTDNAGDYIRKCDRSTKGNVCARTGRIPERNGYCSTCVG